MKDLAFCIFFYFNVCICQHPKSHSSPNFLLTFICMSSSRCNNQLRLLLAVRGILSKLYVQWVALVFLSVDNDNAFAKDPHTAFYFQTDRSADWTLDTSMLDHLIKVTLSSYPRRGFILRNATQICVLVHHLWLSFDRRRLGYHFLDLFWLHLFFQPFEFKTAISFWRRSCWRIRKKVWLWAAGSETYARKTGFWSH